MAFASLDSLPHELLRSILSYLPTPNGPPAIARTCRSLRTAFFSSQSSAILPTQTRGLHPFLSAFAPSLPALNTLYLSSAAISAEAGPIWSSVQPLPAITTLILPNATSSISGATGHPRASTASSHGCLTVILRSLPNLTSLSLCISTPGPHPALCSFLSQENSATSALSRLTSLSVTCAPGALSVAQSSLALLPAVIRAAAPSLQSFTLALPPRILPADFLLTLSHALSSAPALREAHVGIPRYAALPGSPGFSKLPRLSLLTVGICSSSNRALVEHLNLWQSLQCLELLCVAERALVDILSELRHRVARVEVCRKDAVVSSGGSRRHRIAELALIEQTASAAGDGVCVSEVRRAFMSCFKLGRADSSPMATHGIPYLVSSNASQVRAQNFLRITLVKKCQ